MVPELMRKEKRINPSSEVTQLLCQCKNCRECARALLSTIVYQHAKGPMLESWDLTFTQATDKMTYYMWILTTDTLTGTLCKKRQLPMRLISGLSCFLHNHRGVPSTGDWTETKTEKCNFTRQGQKNILRTFL